MWASLPVILCEAELTTDSGLFSANLNRVFATQNQCDFLMYLMFQHRILLLLNAVAAKLALVSLFMLIRTLSYQ